MRCTAVVTALVLCLVAASAQASDWGMDKWMKRESAWKGHGIGSFVTETTTIPMPDMPNMPDVPGMPKGGKMVTTTKTTLTKITETGYVLTVESTQMGRTTTTTRTEPKVRTQKVEAEVKDVGEDAVTVEGKSYPCKVKEVANMDALIGDSMPRRMPGAKPTVSKGKVWESPSEGVLKMETSATVMGHEMTMTWQVSRFKATHKVGTESFGGREVTMTMKSQMGESKMTMIMAPDVPGTLKNVTESAMMGRTTTITTEMTEYTKKPLTATTPEK